MLTWYIPPYVNLSYKKGLKVTISFPLFRETRGSNSSLTISL